MSSNKMPDFFRSKGKSFIESNPLLPEFNGRIDPSCIMFSAPFEPTHVWVNELPSKERANQLGPILLDAIYSMDTRHAQAMIDAKRIVDAYALGQLGE